AHGRRRRDEDLLALRGPPDAAGPGHGVPVPVRGDLEQLHAPVHHARRRLAVPHHRGPVDPHEPGGLAAGDVHHRDHRGPGLDHSADRPVPAAAALLAVRSHRRRCQGVRRTRPGRSAILDRRSSARGRDVVEEEGRDVAAARSETPSRRPTISDVARRAGVSTGTVSRYLNGGRWVSAESSEAVTRAIRETGYVANATARRLRTGRSGTVAFVVDDPPARFFEDPHLESLVIEVGQALAARDQTMVLLLAGDEDSAERAEIFLRTSGVDGAVTASAQPAHHLFERIQAVGIPLVNVGSPAG